MIFFDADDTLWDTDSVFLAAQEQLLKRLAESRFGNRMRFNIEAVRQLDQILALTHPDGLKYPIHLLCDQLVGGMMSVDWWATAFDQYDPDPAKTYKDVCDEYYATISAMPQLYPETKEALEYAAGRGVKLGIFTESSVSTVKRKLAHHGIDEHMFTVIGSDTKTVSAYAVRRVEVGSRPVMIGDQVDKDYTYPRAAGWNAVWVPRNFAPFWTSVFEKPAPVSNLKQAVEKACLYLHK